MNAALDAISLNSDFLIVVLVMVAAATSVFSLIMPLFSGRSVQQRMKAVTLERDKIRKRERERMAKEAQRSQLRQESKTYMKQVVERLNLKRHFGTDTAKLRLSMAGYRGNNAEVVFLFFRMILPISFFLITVFYVFFVLNLQQIIAVKVGICLVAAFIGIKLPEIWVTNLITKRQQLIQLGWPDALDLLVICVESGMPIEQAFQRVAREIGTQSIPLAEELTLLTAELSYLPERRSAYEGISSRTGLLSVKSASQALIQAERHGTHLGEALRVIAQESRDQRMTMAERKAASLPPKLTVPMILCFLPVLILVIISPALITALGWK